MSYHLIARRTVRNACQEAQIVSTVCGFALLVLALVLGARDYYLLCGVVAVLAGGFFGGALAALKIERGFMD